MLAQIRTCQPRLRPSEQRVAAVVLADPEAAVKSSIAALARSAEVSEPTVMRFCRALDFRGFQDFKLALAQELAARVRYARRDIDSSDTAGELASKVIDAAMAGLAALHRQLDRTALERAIAVLAAAHRVECYGSGGAGVIAIDAQLKFSRLGVSTVAYTDAYIYSVTAGLLSPGDAVVAISNSGRSRDLLNCTQLAQQAGASVIAVTAGESPLARIADVALAVDSDSDQESYAPIKTRIAPMVVIDILAIGVALAREPTARERLARMPAILEDKFVAS